MRNFPVILSMMLLVMACGEKPTPDTGGEEETRTLTLTPESVTLAWDADSFELGVKANFAFSASVDASWIALDESSSTSSSLVFNVEKNLSVIKRSATIKVVDKNDKYYHKSVTVSQDVNPNPDIVLSIVDKQATDETKALLANLYNIGGKGFMFGHHDDLWYGRYWYNEPGRSDTKDVCGDYPGVFSVDLASIADNRYNSSENAIRRRVILEARERGEVILAVMHLNNPLTGSDSWDNSKNTVVKEILTEGTATRKKYMEWLDRLADFALGLKDSKGKLVPIILRPYHEHTQGWSWWGSSCTTEKEFISFWQFTVNYLRDTKGVHNFLYAISPQMDSWYTNEEASGRIVFRWPGDDFVDFMGIDCYQGLNPSAFKMYIDALSGWAEKKKKPCGVTEDGQESFTLQNYWTTNILEPIRGKSPCMVVMWRNKYVGNNESDKHYYSVFKGHPSENDFMTMYNDSESYFSRDLPDMYTMPEGYAVK